MLLTCILLLLEGYGEIDMCGVVMSVASIAISGGAGVMQALFPVSQRLVQRAVHWHP